MTDLTVTGMGMTPALAALRAALERIDGHGATRGQHGEAVATLLGLLAALDRWAAMVRESGSLARQLTAEERRLLAAVLGCGAAELDERLSEEEP